jgi:hypothetical protein
MSQPWVPWAWMSWPCLSRMQRLSWITSLCRRMYLLLYPRYSTRHCTHSLDPSVGWWVSCLRVGWECDATVLVALQRLFPPSLSPLPNINTCFSITVFCFFYSLASLRLVSLGAPSMSMAPHVTIAADTSLPMWIRCALSSTSHHCVSSHAGSPLL